MSSAAPQDLEANFLDTKLLCSQSKLLRLKSARLRSELSAERLKSEQLRQQRRDNKGGKRRAE